MDTYDQDVGIGLACLLLGPFLFSLLIYVLAEKLQGSGWL